MINRGLSLKILRDAVSHHIDRIVDRVKIIRHALYRLGSERVVRIKIEDIFARRVL